MRAGSGPSILRLRHHWARHPPFAAVALLNVIGASWCTLNAVKSTNVSSWADFLIRYGPTTRAKHLHVKSEYDIAHGVRGSHAGHNTTLVFGHALRKTERV